MKQLKQKQIMSCFENKRTPENLAERLSSAFWAGEILDSRGVGVKEGGVSDSESLQSPHPSAISRFSSDLRGPWNKKIERKKWRMINKNEHFFHFVFVSKYFQE